MDTKILDKIQKSLSEQNFVLDHGQENALEALLNLSEKYTQNQNKSFFRASPKIEKRGVYLHGAVGRGKTMLMDLFYDALPDDASKYRVHFHSFMKDVHEFLHAHRQNSKNTDAVDKAIPKFASRIAKQTDIICFDEFHITDVADAMILSRLFTALYKKGLFIVMTSNWTPDRLYEGGLQRDRLLSFIALIKDQMDVVELDGAVDYRKLIIKGHPVYFSSLNTRSKCDLKEMIEALTKGKTCQKTILTVKGRELVIPETYGDVAVFSFHDLCERPLGAGDYLEIAKCFRVIIMKDIPQLSTEKRNEAKRLMTLIDILYDAKSLLIISAENTADKIYKGHDHAFEFERTVSRLIEMQSQTYLDEAIL